MTDVEIVVVVRGILRDQGFTMAKRAIPALVAVYRAGGDAAQTQPEQWTPMNTAARQIVETLSARGLMLIEVGPGGKRRQQAIDLVERCIQEIYDEGVSAGAVRVDEP